MGCSARCFRLIGRVVLVCGLGHPGLASALVIKNFDQIANSAGFKEHYEVAPTLNRPVRIAILDNGFAGVQDRIGKSLPSSTQYLKGPVVSSAGQTKHGVFMAELVTALMTDQGRHPRLAPELYLLEASGYTNFNWAIDQAIRLKVDVLLHSMVIEYGSNFDGLGYLNKEVSRAIKAGILWVNASGNFAKTVFNKGPIDYNADQWVNLPGANQSLPVRCTPIKSEKTCRARFVLTWNEFKETIIEGTDKDLDLVLTDDTLNILGGSYLTQVKQHSGRPGETLFPREIIEFDLKPGRYFLRVKYRGGSFERSNSLRVSGIGDGLSFEMNDPSENLHPPADHPQVITVGESDADRSSRSARLKKPEVLAPSIIDLGEGERYAGSSNSAAVVAAALGLLRLKSDEILTRERALSLLTQGGGISLVGQGVPHQALRLAPRWGRCYEPQSIARYAPYMAPVVHRGGLYIETNEGAKMMLPFDPILLAPQIRRYAWDDRIYWGPRGMVLASRQDYRLPLGAIELVEWPSDIPLCGPISHPGWPDFRSGQGADLGFKFINPNN